MTELCSEKFEWFGPSPIEPFNSGPDALRGVGDPRVLGDLGGQVGLAEAVLLGRVDYLSDIH